MPRSSPARSEPVRPRAVVRPARRDDANAMQRIAEAAFARYIPAIGRRPAPMDENFAAAVAAGHALVAVDEGVVGYATTKPDSESLMLLAVAVDPCRQGEGIGRALIDAVEAMARRSGRTRVALYTNEAMTGNLSLYPHLGYAETGRGGQDGFARVYFEKQLGPSIATKRAVGKLYGRRRGQGHKPAEAYERFAIDLSNPVNDPRALFSPTVRRVRLEVGFGAGEHLIARAEEAAEVGHIGVEPFESGMMKAVRAVDRADLKNVRLHMGDARRVLAWLPPACLESVDVLYPDPWHKQRHWKRRFISMDGLDALARVLPAGGTVRFASDIPGYVDWTRAHVHAHPSFVLTSDTDQPWAGWPGTRYEAKALREGRIARYLTLERVATER